MKRDALILLGGLVFAAVPLVVDHYWIGLLTQALIFGGTAVGLDLLVGYTGVASLGHGAFFGMAGYGAALFIRYWGIDPWLAAAMGIAISIAIAVAFAPLAVRVRGLAFLTVTLAFGQVAWGLATRGGNFTGGENGLPGIPRPSLAGVGLDLGDPVTFYLFTVVLVVALTVVLRHFAESAVGMSLLGIRDSDTRMAALGYDVQARRAVAFVVAASVGAVYGAWSAYFNSFVGPGALDWRLSAQMLLSVVMGGAGSLWGPFVAGAGLHVVKTYLTGQTERWIMLLGVLYVVTVVLLPGGLASLPAAFRRLRRRFGGQPAATAEALDPTPVREP